MFWGVLDGRYDKQTIGAPGAGRRPMRKSAAAQDDAFLKSIRGEAAQVHGQMVHLIR